MKFAFYSGSLTKASDILAKAREAVAMGLSKDAAVRALTLSPAEIFGVADRLGSIETGKIANLVLASGDLLEDGTRVEQVIVDGNPYEVPAPAAAMAMGEGQGGRPGRAPDAAPQLVPMARDSGDADSVGAAKTDVAQGGG